MLVIGAVFVDVKGFSFGTYVPEGTNIGDIQIVPGGVCRNVAEDLARLGVHSTFVSMVDTSAMGRDVKESLSALGIDTSHILEVDRGMGMWLAVLDENGDLRGSISRQPDFSHLERYLKENGDALVSACDSIVLELDMNPAIAAEVMRLAEAYQKPVYSVVGNMGVISRHPEYLRRVACFICNEIEAGKLFGKDLSHLSPEEMLPLLVQESRDAGISAMVLTMGAEGAVYVDHHTGEFGRCPALSVNMIDSTGAGDAFFTGTVAALSLKQPLSQAVHVGTQLAFRTLQVAGACCPEAVDLLTETKN